MLPSIVDRHALLCRFHMLVMLRPDIGTFQQSQQQCRLGSEWSHSTVGDMASYSALKLKATIPGGYPRL